MSMLTTTRQRSMLDGAKIEHFMHCAAASGAFTGGCKQIYTIKNGETAPKLIAFYRQDEDSIRETAERLYFSRKMPYYLTKNSFFADQRRNDTLFSLDNIVIDLDDHSGKLDGRQLDHEINRLIFTLDEDYSGRMPAFNLTRSGRGAHLWIPLASFSAKMRLYYSIYAHSLCDTVERAAQEISSPLQIDRAASMNAAGLIRLPFTINQHTGRLATFEQRTTDRHTLDDLQEYCAINLTDTGKPIEKQHGRRCTRSEDDRRAYLPLNQKRIRFLNAIIDRADDLTGRRDLILFLLCNAWTQYTGDAATACEKLDEANRRLSEPLTNAEIASISDYISQKGGLDFKVQSFLDFVCASFDERQLYLYGLPNQKETDRAAARERKEQRICAIIELHRKGMKQTEIATACKCNQSTVARIIAKYSG